MFQNIQGQASFGEEETDYKESKVNKFFKSALTPQKILVYIASFMLSSIECAGGIAPFGIAILAASLSNRVPVLIIYVLTLLGSLVGLGVRNYSYVLINFTCIFSNDSNF